MDQCGTLMIIIRHLQKLSRRGIKMMIEKLIKLEKPYFHLVVLEKLDFQRYYSICKNIENKNLIV